MFALVFDRFCKLRNGRMFRLILIGLRRLEMVNFLVIIILFREKGNLSNFDFIVIFLFEIL